MILNPEMTRSQPDAGGWGLLIDFSMRFDCQLFYSSWESGLRPYRKQDGAWAPLDEDPQIPIFNIHELDDGSEAVRRFLGGIPKKFLGLVSRAKGWQLTVLALLRRNPRAADLLESAPNLFFLGVQSLVKVKKGWRFTGNVFDRKRVDMLAEINGGLSSQALLKMVSKVELEAYGSEELALLARAVRSPDLAHRLRHVPRLTIGDLELLLDDPRLLEFHFTFGEIGAGTLTPSRAAKGLQVAAKAHGIGQRMGVARYGEKVAHEKSVDSLERLYRQWADYEELYRLTLRHGRALGLRDYEGLARENLTPSRLPRFFRKLQRQFDLRRDTLRLGRALRIPQAMALIQAERTLEGLQRLHDDWADAYNRQRLPIQTMRWHRRRCEDDEPVRSGPYFPRPPIPGNADITPILSEADLKYEGACMRTCIGAYGPKIHQGYSAVYRVFRPERATFELKLNHGRLTGVEFRKKGNAMPSKESWEAVRQWLLERVPMEALPDHVMPFELPGAIDPGYGGENMFVPTFMRR